MLGTEHHIVPDIVLFLNGLPVVVIECKSPKVKDAIPEAIDQLLRYSEQRWLNATAQLIADDPLAYRKFIEGDFTLFGASQFNRLGGLAALAAFGARDQVFGALRQSSLVKQSALQQ